MAPSTGPDLPSVPARSILAATPIAMILSKSHALKQWQLTPTRWRACCQSAHFRELARQATAGVKLPSFTVLGWQVNEGKLMRTYPTGRNYSVIAQCCSRVSRRWHRRAPHRFGFQRDKLSESITTDQSRTTKLFFARLGRYQIRGGQRT